MPDSAIAETRLTPKLVDSLYTEAMVLADEARSYFEDHGIEERDGLPPSVRVGYAVESLKVTTRIMHVIAWLLSRRSRGGETVDPIADARPDRRLGDAAASDADILTQLPDGAVHLIEASEDLYGRVKRFEQDLLTPPGEMHPKSSPARALLGRLERSF